MFRNTVLLAFILPTLARATDEGNIHLLEEEIADAIAVCESTSHIRQERSDHFQNSPKIDGNAQDVNQYGHVRRPTNDTGELHVFNTTDYDYDIDSNDKNMSRTNRTKRSEPLSAKFHSDECLSQCVFANMEVVDRRGIPREEELWARVRTVVTSQQSRGALKDQLRACFQELHSESEDDGCSYSNKLERCLMLRITERKRTGSSASDV